MQVQFLFIQCNVLIQGIQEDGFRIFQRIGQDLVFQIVITDRQIDLADQLTIGRAVNQQ